MAAFSSPTHDHSHQHPSLLLDPLCCQEEGPIWEEDEEEEEYPDHPAEDMLFLNVEQQRHVEEEETPPVVMAQTLLDWEAGGGEEGGRQVAMMDWEEDEELSSLSSKEGETYVAKLLPANPEADDGFMSWRRREAVGWMLRACARHGFTAQTTLLSVDYLDRFLSSTTSSPAQTERQQQPWMVQLSAVACLSLAAKVEETHVPLLLDLQVEETRYVFEAKTIQRMELLVLSTLGWRMSSVTPISFLDHFIRRMTTTTISPSINNKNTNMNNSKKRNPSHLLLHWDFQARCHSILLSLVADPRWVQFLPSVLAAATMLHAVNQLEQPPSSNSFTITITTTTLENHLLALLNVTKDQLQECSEFILGSMGSGVRNKRKNLCSSPSSSLPPSPKEVVGSTFSCDSSNDSWVASSVSSSPEPPPWPRAFKRANSVVAVEKSGAKIITARRHGSIACSSGNCICETCYGH